MGDRLMLGPVGWKCLTTGAGVLKVAVAALARVAPSAALVPAGTVTVKLVAIGNRSTAVEAAAKRRVSVPIHCQLPRTLGMIVAGARLAATWATVAIGIIGRSKVMPTKGA